MVQIDKRRRKVFIKFSSRETLNKHIKNIQGTKEYKHENGVLSVVELSEIGLGLGTKRVAGLPPKIHDNMLRDIVTKYEMIKEIKRNNEHRYTDTLLKMALRLVQLELKKKCSFPILCGRKQDFSDV
jgi:hypothetical protein